MSIWTCSPGRSATVGMRPCPSLVIRGGPHGSAGKVCRDRGTDRAVLCQDRGRPGAREDQGDGVPQHGPHHAAGSRGGERLIPGRPSPGVPPIWTRAASCGAYCARRARYYGAGPRGVTQPEPRHDVDVPFLLHAAELLPGDPQVDDRGLLYAAAARVNARPMERDVYGSAFLKAAALLETLARMPCLEHSNAAFAWHSCEAYLGVNGYVLDYEPKDAVALVRDSANQQTGVFQIARQLRAWSASDQGSTFSRGSGERGWFVAGADGDRSVGVSIGRSGVDGSFMRSGGTPVSSGRGPTRPSRHRRRRGSAGGRGWGRAGRVLPPRGPRVRRERAVGCGGGSCSRGAGRGCGGVPPPSFVSHGLGWLGHLVLLHAVWCVCGVVSLLDSLSLDAGAGESGSVLSGAVGTRVNGPRAGTGLRSRARHRAGCSRFSCPCFRFFVEVCGV